MSATTVGYRPTFLDRRGADGGVVLQWAGWNGYVGAAGAQLCGFASLTRNGGVPAFVGWAVAGGFVSGALSMVWTHVLSAGAGAGLAAFIQPSGASCPPERQFSLQQAMAARGDVTAALASSEDLIRAAPPDDASVRLRAADLYVESKVDAGRAATLYGEVQRMRLASAGDFTYATNRRISLYLGVLADRGKAMGELRRLIDRHPTSDVGAPARRALAALKADGRGDG